MTPRKSLAVVSLLAVGACTDTSGTSSTSTRYPSTTTATTLTVFSDNAGVARIVSPSGGELVYIAPDIAADVAVVNANGTAATSIVASDYSIISQTHGYNLRQGTTSSGGQTYNVVIAEKIGTNKASIAYIYNNYGSAIGAGDTVAFSAAPTGAFTYSGLFVAGSRSSSFAEIGTSSLTADFDRGTFSINSATNSTSLTGTGYIDSTTGRISSGTLVFNSPYGTNYTATTLGTLSGTAATEVSGVFYTNDINPDYAGAFAGSR